MSVQQYLCCKLQVAAEVGGIHHYQHGIRLNAIKRAAQAVATHACFGHIDRQGVGARKINQLQFGTTIRRAMRADPSFNGGSRKVGSTSTHAAQAVEEGGLTGIRIAKDRNARDSVAATGAGCGAAGRHARVSGAPAEPGESAIGVTKILRATSPEIPRRVLSICTMHGVPGRQTRTSHSWCIPMAWSRQRSPSGRSVSSEQSTIARWPRRSWVSGTRMGWDGSVRPGIDALPE